MSDYDKFNKGNKRKEVVGRNANFVLLAIWAKFDWIESTFENLDLKPGMFTWPDLNQR